MLHIEKYIKPNTSYKMFVIKNEMNQKTCPFYGRSIQIADVENGEQKRIEWFKCITDYEANISMKMY